MSETQDEFIYNYYDYMSSIYVYSHVKTYLIDPNRQRWENYSDIFLLGFSGFFFLAAAAKLIIIMIYFIFINALTSLIKSFGALCKIKFKTNLFSWLKNAGKYLLKVCKRIFTFNFYLHQNFLVGILMIFSFLLYLCSSVIFYSMNLQYLTKTEKSRGYMRCFYLHFESILLIQLLYATFYASRNTTLSTLVALGIFILLNLILYLGYLIKEKIENVEGIFEHNEPQLIMNILFNIIFLLLYIKCLINVITFNNNITKYKLLLKEKEYFYNDDNTLIILEENKIPEILKNDYILKGEYYSLDDHNIFKREDRYERKIFLLIIFIILTLYNIAEIIISIYLLVAKPDLNQDKLGRRIGTMFINMINIFCILLLTTSSSVKSKIKTIIYY